MKKLLKYILALIITVSLVHITIDIIDFAKEVTILKDHQLKAKVRAERMMHPTVKITSIVMTSSLEAGSAGYLTLSAATGFSIKYDIKNNESLVITNDHFCKTNLSDVSFIIEDYSKSSFESNRSYLDGKIVLTESSLDLCLIKVNGYIRPVILASHSYTPRAFEEIYVVGGPYGDFPIIFDSYISSIISRREVALGLMSPKGNSFLLISEQVFPGHSGSPVFTKDGKVIGIIFGALRTYGGLAISVKDIYKILELVKE
jgi:S1-C subfamily serine protease